MHMLHSREMKKGFTMVEILVVLTIMGILSAMGVSTLRDAVINNRVKDASLNVAAYLERVANETNRISDKVCVKTDDKKEIYAAKGSCNSASKTNKISSYTLEGPLEFDTGKTGKDCSENWLADGAEFEPRFGLSAAPMAGCIVIKYNGSDKAARVLKKSTKNKISPQISYDNGTSWTDL